MKIDKLLAMFIVTFIVLGAIFIIVDQIIKENSRSNEISEAVANQNDNYLFTNDAKNLQKFINNPQDLSLIVDEDNKEIRLSGFFVGAKANNNTEIIAKYNDKTEYLETVTLWYRYAKVDIIFEKNKPTKKSLEDLENFEYKEAILSIPDEYKEQQYYQENNITKSKEFETMFTYYIN